MFQIPEIAAIRERTARIPAERPIVAFMAQNRDLGFQSRSSPPERLRILGEHWGAPLRLCDPQRVLINAAPGQGPELYDDNGTIDGSVHFIYGHTSIDRGMCRYIAAVLDAQKKKIVPSELALRVGDDKALTAVELAKHRSVPFAQSVIASARANPKQALELLGARRDGSENIILKVSGAIAGGIGVQPLPADPDYLTPAFWASRLDSRARILQRDEDRTPAESPRRLMKGYVVGGQFAGCFVSEGHGIVNNPGLVRDGAEYPFVPTEAQQRIFVTAAEAVGAGDYCEVDACGGEHFVIIDINPLAAIDVEEQGINLYEALLWHLIRLATDGRS